MESNRNRTSLVIGAGLIFFGLLTLVGQFLGWDFLGNLWPLVVIGIGAAFFVGMVLGGKSVSGLAIPGSILIGIGLILLAQNWLGWWETWSYAWALIISFVGIGQVIQGYWAGEPEQRRHGWNTARSGVILFLILGAIFEFIFSSTGVSSRGSQAVWALVLVGAGLLQLGYRLVNLLRRNTESSEAHNLFGPIFLIGIGGVAFLASQGSEYLGRMVSLLSLWPVLLIAAGVTVLFGRRSAIVSGLLGVLVVGLMFTVMLAGDRLGLKPNPIWFTIGSSQGSGERITGSGTTASTDFELTNIRSISHEAIGSLQIIQGQDESLSIEADDNILPYIKVNASGGNLRITLERGYSFSPQSEVRMVLTVKDLDRVSISGAGSAYSENITTDDLSIELSGAGSVKIDTLQARELEIQISGAGSAMIAGKVDELKVEISGAGSFEAPDLECARAEITIPGMGNARLWVTEELQTRISGMGTISYYGNPTIEKNNSGFGTIRSLGDK